MDAVARLHVPIIEPFPWQMLLQYLDRRAIPDVENIDGESYVRTMSVGPVRVRADLAAHRLSVTLPFDADADFVRDRIAHLFDTTHASDAVSKHLRRFPLFTTRLRRVPGMRPLGAWSAFELTLRTIVGQQVTVAAAGTLMRRLSQRCGSLTPECVCEADLRALGMPGRRVSALQELARAVLDKRLSFDQPWTRVDEQLRALPGIGPWTRSYLALRLGRDPDAFPASDLGLIRAANVHSPAELLKLAESWRPYRAYAAIYLWAVPEHSRL